MDKKELCRLITEDLFREELLNEADAESIEALERTVQNVIFEHLQNYIIVSGHIVE